MAQQIVMDWTEVSLADDQLYTYRVIKDDDHYVQQIRRSDGVDLGTFDLPSGVKKDKQSYEVLLRYALSQIAA